MILRRRRSSVLSLIFYLQAHLIVVAYRNLVTNLIKYSGIFSQK